MEKDVQLTIPHENTYHVLGCRALVTCSEHQMAYMLTAGCGWLEQ